MKQKDGIKYTIVVAVVVLLAVGMTLWLGGEKSTITGPDGQPVVIAGDCNIAPSLSLSLKDAQLQGTTISTAGTLYFVNGEYFSTAPSFARGDKVQVIRNLTSYIDVLSEEITMECGANSISSLMFDYAAPTVSIKEDNTALTDGVSGNAVNGSAVGSGGSETFEVFFTGADKDSTGDFVYVIELGSTANVSRVTMYDSTGAELQEVDVPGFYVDTLTSPYKIAYKVPAIVGAKEVSYKLTFVAKSGKAIAGAVYTTAYVGEPLVDTDGSIIAWGVEDSDSTANYEATFDYDIFLA